MLSSFVHFSARFTLVFWLVSFTFYAGIVIPAGTEALGAIQQGFVTQRVTAALNILATLTVSLLLLARPVTGSKRTFWCIWLVMVVCQTALFPLRMTLTNRLDFELGVVREGTNFYVMHQVYLWVSILQWLSGIAMLVLVRRNKRM